MLDFRNGEVVASGSVPAGCRIGLDVAGRAGDWFSVILRDQDRPTLDSNAIYVK